MASDRMTQALGALERAIDQLENTMPSFQKAAAATPSLSDRDNMGMDRDRARAALRSLDDLISELKGMTDGGATGG